MEPVANKTAVPQPGHGETFHQQGAVYPAGGMAGDREKDWYKSARKL